MSFSRQFPRRRYAHFQPLESRRLLALIAGESQARPAEPVIEDADWQLDIPGDRLDAEASARAYLATISDQLGFRPDTSDLIQVQVKHGLASTHSRFQQVAGGMPVHGSTVTVNQGPDGTIQNYYASTFPELTLPTSAVGGVSFTEADQLAQQMAGVQVEDLPSRGTQVWLPLDDGSARLAWRIEVYSLEPVGEFLTLIDAATGEVYSQVNQVAQATGSGDVFDPNPYQTKGNGAGLFDANDANSPALEAELRRVTLQGLDEGTGLLRGEFVDLATLNSPTLPDVDADEPEREYHYTRDDPRFEQVVIYYAVDQVQRYIHALGYDDANPISNGIRDYPTLANAHWSNEDNSYFVTSGTGSIRFGDGGVDDGEDADIVVHEYGHAIQFDQNSNWRTFGEMGAMGEGFGDYLAASTYELIGDPAYQASHAPCIAEWDATSYSGTNPPCLRRVDGNKQYPDDLTGQIHSDGEIWSAALWEMRAELGATTTDTLVLEHHFGLPGGATMPIAAAAIVQADANLNGGQNEQTIRDVFCGRGILSGNECLPPDPEGRIEGTVWNDLNGDGVRDGGEPGLSGWTVYLDANQNGTLDAFTTDVPSTDVPVEEIDNQTVTSTTIVSGLAGVISDVNVTLDISHLFISDMEVELEAPTGQRVLLFTNVGGTEADMSGTTFDDEASVPIGNGTAPFSGSFIPEEPLSLFDGIDPNGTWTLHVADVFPSDAGTLNSWSLSIETAETATTSEVDGTYVLTTEVLDTFTVAQLPQPDWQQTHPAGGVHQVTVGPGETVTGIDFGNQSTLPTAEVIGRHVFYNNSAFDGYDPASNALDSDAVATDKLPLFPGETASFATITSFTGGINGVIIDVAGLAEPGQLSFADFVFRHGNDQNLSNWKPAANPEISVEVGGGAGGSDRVTLIWPDRTFTNQWLEIRFRATPTTGLAADELFYFGNAVGETGNMPGDTTVNAADFQAIRLNGKTFLDPAVVDDLFDINRDRRVNVLDLLTVRDHNSTIAELLALISP